MTAAVMMMRRAMMMRIAAVMTRQRANNPKASMPLGETSGRLGGLACVRARTNQVDDKPGGGARERDGNRMLRRRAFPAVDAKQAWLIIRQGEVGEDAKEAAETNPGRTNRWMGMRLGKSP
jgi:hypothetical protein